MEGEKRALDRTSDAVPMRVQASIGQSLPGFRAVGKESIVPEKAFAKHLQIYIEFPASLPGIAMDTPRKSVWERVVVASDAFGAPLPPEHILMLLRCEYIPAGISLPAAVSPRN